MIFFQTNQGIYNNIERKIILITLFKSVNSYKISLNVILSYDILSLTTKTNKITKTFIYVKYI